MPGPFGSNLLGQYDPAQISVYIAGTLIGGFGEDFLNFVPRENEYNDDIGLDGEIVRWPSNNYSADLTISLLPVSPSNAVLQALLLADRLTGSNYFSIMIKDVGQGKGLSSNIITDTLILPLCWIKQEPKITWRKGIATRDWPITVGLSYPILTGSGILS